MQQTEKCTDQEGEKSHGAGKTLKGVIKFHSRAGDSSLLHWKARSSM